MVYDSVRPGRLWLDTGGKPIQAHGFTVFYDEAAKEYKWFGENKEKSRFGGTVWHWGVRLYTSKDLYNWDDRGLIIPPPRRRICSPRCTPPIAWIARTSFSAKRPGNMLHG